MKPRQAQRRLRQAMDPGPIAEDERRRLGMASSGRLQILPQSEFAQHNEPFATDEFAANAMPRVVSGFPQLDWHATLPEAKPQGQTAEPTSDDCDRSRLSHG